MTKFRTLLSTLAAGALLAFPAVSPAASQGLECLTNRQVQGAIESGQILSWPKIKGIAGISDYEEVSNAKVCMIDGAPYYVVNVISPSGEASKITLNAVDGTQKVL
jgi:hypothetical protein